MIKFDEQEYTALCKVIDYIEDIELTHWKGLGKPRDHIYHDIVIVSLALQEFKYKTDCERQLQLREEQS